MTETERKLREALTLVVERAESYVGIGFDTGNESASLMDACDAARSLLAESSAGNSEPPRCVGNRQCTAMEKCAEGDPCIFRPPCPVVEPLRENSETKE